MACASSLVSAAGVRSVALPRESQDHLYPHYVDDGYFTPTRYNPFRAAWSNRSLASRDRQLQATDDQVDDANRNKKMDCQNPECPCYFDTYDEGDCGTADEQCPCCIRCLQEEMDYCGEALGGKLVEDQYYPTTKSKSGSCENIDERVGTLDVFGKGKTFRDNAECRELVQEYVCLWWGSENAQYENRCNNGGQAVKPCRSFCVQVGLVCANNEDWMNLCYDIPCSAGAGE